MRQGTRWAVIATIGLIAGCSRGTPSEGNATAPAPTPPAPSPQSISGTYVAFGQDGSSHQFFVEALRLTQSAPGQFTGTLEGTEVTPAGQSHSTEQNVTGSYDGTHVTLSLDQGIGHTNRTATWAPGSITMSWMQENGQLATEQFVAKTDADYAAMLQKLGTARQELVATDAAQKKAQAADKDTAQFAENLQHFLSKEATWNLEPAQTRHTKAVAYGDAGVAKIKKLLALHQSMADVNANQVEVEMNTAGIQLGLQLDTDARAVEGAREKMANIDHAIDLTPCLASDGTLVPNPLPACAPLPDLVAKYRAIHASAVSMLAQASSLNQATRQDYDARLKEAQALVAAR